LAAEEVEEIVRLGLERLVQRRVLEQAGGRVCCGAHRQARDLLAYYARSLAALEQPSVRPVEARLGMATEVCVMGDMVASDEPRRLPVFLREHRDEILAPWEQVVRQLGAARHQDRAML